MTYFLPGEGKGLSPVVSLSLSVARPRGHSDQYPDQDSQLIILTALCYLSPDSGGSLRAANVSSDVWANSITT